METALASTRTGWSYTALADGPAEGTLVILLHGFPQNRHTWREQVPALGAAGYRAVAPDQRGYSPGARPDPTDLTAYVIDRLVEDVLDFADADAPGTRFHLVGHDWGGAVAWMTAARHPDRVRSLVVLSRPHPSAFRQALEADADGQQHRSRHHRAFLDAGTGPLLLADGARRLRRSLEDQGVPSRAADRYLETLADPSAMEAALAWYRAAAAGSKALGLPASPPPAALDRIPVPTMYIWGDTDATVGPHAASATSGYVAGPYGFEVVSGAGHFLTDQVPDTITALLLNHLRNHN